MEKSMIGKWDEYYREWPKGKVGCYGQGTTCELAYEWLKECNPIEDWGCGRGFFQSLCKPGQCRNLDCSCTPWADEQVDLVVYTSKVPGIQLRGVLEHNEDWEKILRNALNSFTERMALTLFTPFVDKQIDAWPDPSGVPCYSFAQSQIESILESCGVQWKLKKNIPVAGMFPVEHIFYIWKDEHGPEIPGMDIEASGSVDNLELAWLYEQSEKMSSIIEIGSLRGRSTKALLSGCKGKVYAVDRWPGTEGHDAFMKNVGHFLNVIPVWEFSSQAAKHLPNADMIFIDADHRYEFVLEDLKLWEPKAQILICGHDYRRDVNTDPNDVYGSEVERAVDDYFGKGNYSIFQSIWYKWWTNK